MRPVTVACKHPKGPEGYVERLEWLERMSKRYKQEKCPSCGLYAKWRLPQRLPQARAKAGVQKNATRKEWQNHGE